MTLAEKVKTGRKNLNWTQSDLALRCGVTLRTIQRIEKGEVTPSAYTLGKLVELLSLEQLTNLPSQNTEFDKVIPARFSKKIKTYFLLMISTTLLLFLAFSWFTSPLSVRDEMEKKVALSTINCESKASTCDLQLTVLDASGNIQLQKTYGGFFNEYGEKISLSDGVITLEGLQQKCTTANVSNDCYLEKWTFEVDPSGKLIL